MLFYDIHTYMNIIEAFLTENEEYHFTAKSTDYSSRKSLFLVKQGSFTNYILYLIPKTHDFDQFFDCDPLYSQYDYSKHSFKLLGDHHLGPHIDSWNDEHGIILMDYVGESKLGSVVYEEPKMYISAIEQLIKMQQIPIDDLTKSRHYGKYAITKENILSIDSIKFMCHKDKVKLEIYLADLLRSIDINSLEECICHRDYQMRNLMYHNNKVYIIDSQDCCVGNYIYDLASLLFQSIHVLSMDTILEYGNYFHKTKNVKDSFEDFWNKLCVLGLFRVLKSYSTHLRYFTETDNWMSRYLIENNKIHLGNLGLKFSPINNMINKYRLVPIILAAGKGKRMQSESPKALCEINGRSMLELILDKLVKLDPWKIVIVIGYKKEEIINKLKSYPYHHIEFVEQKEQLGTGHAVLQAKQVLSGINCMAMVHFSDTPNVKYNSLVELIKKHSENEHSILMTHKNEPCFKHSGRIIRQNNRIIKIYEDENKDYVSDEFLGGVQIHRSDILFDNLDKIQNQNKQKEYYLTDLVEIIAHNHVVDSLIVPKEELINVNTKVDLQNAHI